MNELPFRGDDEIQLKSTPKLSEEFEDLNELFEGFLNNSLPSLNTFELLLLF
jgi:hypothetical protein